LKFLAFVLVLYSKRKIFIPFPQLKKSFTQMKASHRKENMGESKQNLKKKKRKE